MCNKVTCTDISQQNSVRIVHTLIPVRDVILYKNNHNNIL